MIQRTVLSPEDVDQMIKDHALWQKTGYRAGQQADFSNCDLSGIAIVCHGREPLFLLEHVNFQNADLSASTIERFHFKNCNFSDVRMDRVNIRGTAFEHCDFSGARLYEADLNVVLMKDNDFDNASFRGTQLSYGVVIDNIFNETNLDMKTSVKCYLEGNQFIKVNPVYANFSNTMFLENTFSGSTFMQCRLDNAIFKACQFDKSGFLDSYIEKCSFPQSNIEDQFIYSRFDASNGNTIHFVCDLGQGRIIGRDLFDDRASMRINDFIKEIVKMSESTKEESTLKKILYDYAKMCQKAHRDYQSGQSR